MVFISLMSQGTVQAIVTKACPGIYSILLHTTSCNADSAAGAHSMAIICICICIARFQLSSHVLTG